MWNTSEWEEKLLEDVLCENSPNCVNKARTLLKHEALLLVSTMSYPIALLRYSSTFVRKIRCRVERGKIFYCQTCKWENRYRSKFRTPSLCYFSIARPTDLIKGRGGRVVRRADLLHFLLLRPFDLRQFTLVVAPLCSSRKY